MSQGDRNNFSGDTTLVAPTGGVVRGQVYLIGASYWVARETASAGDSFAAASPAHGAVEVAKPTGTGTALAVGAKIYVKDAKVEGAASTGSSLVLGGIGVLRAAGVADDFVLVGPVAMTNNVT